MANTTHACSVQYDRTLDTLHHRHDAYGSWSRPW
jgi:hypothetical protein